MNKLGWCALAFALFLGSGCLDTDLAAAASDGATASDASTGGALGAACVPGAAGTCATGLDCPTGVYDATGPRCTYTCDTANPNPLCTGGCNPKGYCRLPQ